LPGVLKKREERLKKLEERLKIMEKRLEKLGGDEQDIE